MLGGLKPSKVEYSFEHTTVLMLLTTATEFGQTISSWQQCPLNHKPLCAVALKDLYNAKLISPFL